MRGMFGETEKIVRLTLSLHCPCGNKRRRVSDSLCQSEVCPKLTREAGLTSQGTAGAVSPTMSFV